MDNGTEFVLKERVEEANLNWEIAGLTFDVLSSAEIVKYSNVRITHAGMYSTGAQSKPLAHGPLDLHLGANRADRNVEVGRCATCQGTWEDCVGHWGYVKLPQPMFHAGYFKWVLAILYCVCKSCSCILLAESEVLKYLKRMRRLSGDPIRKKAAFKSIVAESKKITQCPKCGSLQGMLRRINQGTPDKFMKVVHEIKQKEHDGKITKIMDDITGPVAYRILSNISARDCEALDITRPDRLMLDVFMVPPSSIRPTINLGDAGVNEDDLSATLRDIVQTVNQISSGSSGGLGSNLTLNQLEILQAHTVRFINSEYPQLEAVLNSLDRGGSAAKVGRGVCQRLKGKEGRFRGNLSGKRVDFSGRTVISPDPNCPVPCVVVPIWSARRLTYPERVGIYNIERLREAVCNGPDEWPGALSVKKRRDNFKTSLRFVNRRQISTNLELGDLVERHMIDDDVVLFNRQPSLHRLSIMAHKARVMEWRTLRFNECVCSPYNADFDGDEMNCHLPQTEEARVEALYLMGVVNNLTTPKNAEPLVAATQDFLSGSWMICHKDVFLTRDKFCHYICYFSDGCWQIDMPPPAILKPVELWTGKQLYNVLLRPNKSTKLILNFELKERDFQKPKDGLPDYMCRYDGYVVFRQTELMCGALGKAVLGGGSKTGLFFHIIRDNNPALAADIMGRIARLTGRWFADRGMTIGIDDVTPSEIITDKKWGLLARGFEKVEELNESYRSGKMKNDPGSTVAETLENRSKGILDELRNENGKMAIDTLHPLNKPLIMFLSGAKGAIINMAQMIALVGQQNVNGKRIWNGFVKRTLPHYSPIEVGNPKSKGFVANSFYTGLTPDEFFFHTMSGREGLVDTAVKTADTGYMQRRLVKALEDLSVKYDKTVRTSDGQIVQFVYGDDGLNPQLIEHKLQLLDISAAFNHAKSSRMIKTKSKELQRDFQRPSKIRKTTSQIDASDQILPPNSDTLLYENIAQVVKAFISPRKTPVSPEIQTILDELPKSLQHKLTFLKNYIKRNSSDDPDNFDPFIDYLIHFQNTTANDMIVEPINESTQVDPPMSNSQKREKRRSKDRSEMDPMLVQVRDQILIHVVVWLWLTEDKREAPLLPYEFVKWGEYMAEKCRELQPSNINIQAEKARREEPTHQPKTDKVRDFGEEISTWFVNKASEMANYRESNGELPGLTEADYFDTLAMFKYDIQTDRCMDSRIKTTLDRRQWILPDSKIVIKDIQNRAGGKIGLGGETSGSMGLAGPIGGPMGGSADPLSDPLSDPMTVTVSKRRKWKLSHIQWVNVLNVLEFYRLLWRKYNRALIESGEAVGAIGAQSIGEPGTQMTLKTFHFAGVASMNVTLGVPRIKEIINAASKIMTPIIQLSLSINSHSFSFAQMVKSRLERTTLGQVCSYVKQVLAPEGTWIVVRLCQEMIQESYLEIDASTVRDSILASPNVSGMKLRDTLIEVVHKWKLIVKPPGGGKGLSFQITALMDGLLHIPVAGLPNVRRSVIQKIEDSKSGNITYALALEGEGLSEIMAIDGVQGNTVRCNNIMEVKQVLGIEAARQTIISEIKGCMDAYSMDIDLRHMLLLGDVMTFRGEVLGISRFGIQKMRASVLSIASFEETNEHLFEAAVHKKSEHVLGVSEAIILGKRVAVGTGAFEVLHNAHGMGGSWNNKSRRTFTLARLKSELKK